MILLDTTTRKLQVVLASSTTTNVCQWTSSYVDITSTSAGIGASSNGVSNGTTAVDVVAAPGSSTTRKVLDLSFYNADTVSSTVSVIYYDNGTSRIVEKITLSVGDSLLYSDITGWRVVDSSGNIKVSSGSSVSYPISVANGGTGATTAASARANLGTPVRPDVSPYRLGLSSNWVDTSDVTGATTLYANIGQAGNLLSLYDTSTSTWYYATAAQLSLSLSGLTASTLYDIYVYNSGTIASPTLTLQAVAWSSSTAGSSSRATALDITLGVPCKSGALGYKYLGTIMTTSTAGQSEDSITSRLVWNQYNKDKSPVRVTTSTPNWTYSTTTWRQANGDSTLRINAVFGMSQSVRLDLQEVAESTAGGDNTYVGIGIDSTSSQSIYGLGGTVQMIAANRRQPMLVSLDVTVSAGYHYFAWMEKGYGSNTQTFYGNMGGGALYYGITGSIKH